MDTRQHADALERGEHTAPIPAALIMAVITELLARLAARKGLRQRVETLEALVRAQAQAIAELQEARP